jgi:hypothetical protein
MFPISDILIRVAGIFLPSLSIFIVIVPQVATLCFAFVVAFPVLELLFFATLEFQQFLEALQHEGLVALGPAGVAGVEVLGADCLVFAVVGAGGFVGSVLGQLLRAARLYYAHLAVVWLRYSVAGVAGLLGE